MAVNKVVYDGNSLIDLTNDTVTPDTLARGVTAHAADGTVITGVAPTTAVLYTAQTLTDAQQQQARDNIGIDVVSAHHSWSGTTLTITSASGTSSANLKGEKGDKGDKGDTGGTGATGATGQRGTGILKITTAPSSYTTATGGFTPTYRASLSTVKTQSKVNEVLVGDVIQYSYYQYPVGYVDSSYVYTGARTSIRGSTGAAGTAGADGITPVRGVDYWTDADKEYIIQQVLAALNKPSYTNQIPISTDLSGNTLTNGVLYTDKRWNSSGGQSSATGYFVSGLIPAKQGDAIQIRWPGGGEADNLQIRAFASDRTPPYTGYLNFTTIADTSHFTHSAFTGAGALNIDIDNGILDFTIPTGTTVNALPSTTAFITVTLYGAPADCIVTVNQAIN